MHALVIDDSRVVRSLLGNILRGLGFQVTEAGDGQAGLDRLREGADANVALVDWNMPIMTGIEFVRAVRAQPEYDSLRLLMVTTETETTRICEALESGADEYLMKPFTSEALQEKLVLLGLTG